jgi:hypothetical protein
MALTKGNKMSNPKRIGLKERPRRTPATRELSQRNSSYNLQVGAAELGGVIQKYGGNYILAFAAMAFVASQVLPRIKTQTDFV